MSPSTEAGTRLPTAPSAMRRVLRVARLHVTNPVTVIVTPLLILGAIFAVNWVIWWLIASNASAADAADAREGFQYSGASFFLLVYMMVVAVQAISVTFPFALGYGVTRRDYCLGSSVAFVGLALLFTAVYAVLGALEQATGGWGLGGRMFTAVYFGTGSWVERSFAVFAGLLLFLFVGAAAAAVWVRWRATGLTAFFAALAFLGLGAAVLLTATASWPAFGRLVAALGWTGSYAVSLVVTASAAIAGYLILRRATPRS